MINVNQPNRIQTIVENLETELIKRKDLVVHPGDMRMTNEGTLVSRDKSLSNFHVTDWALGQLGNKTGLPLKYLRKCPAPLQAINVNHWLSELNTEEQNPWLIRTHQAENNGIVRGILSERYSPFDDYEIMDIVNGLTGGADVDINFWHRDDTGFHLRLVYNDLTTTIGTTPDGRPDIHKVGLHIENSEVGKKSLRVTPLVWRLVCSNGLMGWGTNEEAGIFQQRHMFLKPHEMYGRVAEAINNGLQTGDKALERLVEAKETPIENPLDVIQKLAEKRKYSKEFTEKVQGAFLEEAGDNAFYVVQAFTRACQLSNSVDFRTEVEKDATKMLESLLVTV